MTAVRGALGHGVKGFGLCTLLMKNKTRKNVIVLTSCGYIGLAIIALCYLFIFPYSSLASIGFTQAPEGPEITAYPVFSGEDPKIRYVNFDLIFSEGETDYPAEFTGRAQYGLMWQTYFEGNYYDAYSPCVDIGQNSFSHSQDFYLGDSMPVNLRIVAWDTDDCGGITPYPSTFLVGDASSTEPFFELVPPSEGGSTNYIPVNIVAQSVSCIDNASGTDCTFTYSTSTATTTEPTLMTVENSFYLLLIFVIIASMSYWLVVKFT